MNDTPTPTDAQWQAQDAAFALANTDATRHDRLLRDAMRAPPSLALPPNFARDVARLAKHAAAEDTRVERGISAALGVCLGIGGTWIALRDGAAWWQASVDLLPGSSAATAWVATMAACVAASWLATALSSRARLPR